LGSSPDTSSPAPKNFEQSLPLAPRKPQIKKKKPSNPGAASLAVADNQRGRKKKSLRSYRQRRPWNWKNFFLNLVNWGVIIAAAGLVAFSLWTGLWMMIEPDSIVWLNRYLPIAQQITPVQKNPPQTLEVIKADLNQKGFQLGELITFQNDILLPISRPIPDCTSPETPRTCQRISELRLYQPLANKMFIPGGNSLYQLKRQLVISDLEESFVIAPLVSAGVTPPGTSKPLPFSSLAIDPQAPKQGVWLHLTGKRNNILYGQVIHYNPNHSYLSVMAEWTSPNGILATWQQIHGDPSPELVVDRSVGLEPSFRTYQIQPRDFVLDPLWLVEITLNKAAIDIPPYQNALILARQGLWSESIKILAPLKGKPPWSETAQAQLDLIQLHANITTTQAKAGWANPSQAILAQLLDGRWKEALDLLESIDNSTQMQEIVTLLKKDRGQLAERVRVTLQFSPQETSARIWGALIISTKEGKSRAIASIQPPDSSKDLSKNLKKVPVNDAENSNQNPAQPSNLVSQLSQYLRLLELGN